MVEVRCEECDNLMTSVDIDSRQEWVEETYSCECGETKIHRTEFNQIGLVTSDEIM